MYLVQFSLLLSFAFFPVLTKVLPPVLLAARRDLSINDTTKELTMVNSFFDINQINETNSNREVQHILDKRQFLTTSTTKEPIIVDEEDIVDVTFIRAEKHLGRFLFVSLPVAIILILFTLIMCVLTRPGTHFMGYFDRPPNELCRHQKKTVDAVKRKYETGTAAREKQRTKRLAREKTKKKAGQPRVTGESRLSRLWGGREQRKAKLLAQKEKKKKQLEKKREALLKKRGKMYKTDHDKQAKEYEAIKAQKEKEYEKRRASQQRSSGSLRAASSKSLSSKSLSSKSPSSKSLSSTERKSLERLSKVKLQEKEDIIKDAEKARKRKAKQAKKAEKAASLSRIDSMGRVRGPRRKGG